jgi:hypothetical protein
LSQNGIILPSTAIPITSIENSYLSHPIPPVFPWLGIQSPQIFCRKMCLSLLQAWKVGTISSVVDVVHGEGVDMLQTHSSHVPVVVGV